MSTPFDIPTMSTVARRKLGELIAEGHQVCGLMIARQNADGTETRGAVSAGGLVIWWHADRCPGCGYQHGHAIGCAHNPFDIALKAQAEAKVTGVAAHVDGVPIDPYHFGSPGEPDPLLPEARALVTAPDGKGSISMVQRKLRIGYNRAARLLEALEAEGVVGPMDRLGGRPVLVRSGTYVQHLPSDDTEGGAT